ncbi:hypothetical protein DWU98_19965 [Dyella monticola]|uniref:Uncharacterized protein n=1 Tax=Dyella monticola TaxID=1927958 RepID=A0A370WS81_9GAMM|nr:hypothetical protein DWU98_19965 [Dyella monticola]
MVLPFTAPRTAGRGLGTARMWGAGAARKGFFEPSTGSPIWRASQAAWDGFLPLLQGMWAPLGPDVHVKTDY